MKVLIAPDSFKGTYSATKISKYIEQGLKLANKSAIITKIPMADGGEGTIDALAPQGEIHKLKVRDPLGKKTTAKFAILKDKTAIIEMAEASGLYKITNNQRNPMLTTTYGVGQLIKGALNKKANKIIIGVGGSATTDAGLGMAQALGVKFLDKLGKEIHFRKQQGYSGGSLKYLSKIDISNLDKRIKKTKIFIACDVDNPLYGRKGAAYVYGPQKGATKRQVKVLDSYLKNFSKTVKLDLNKHINISGAGASGGLAAGFIAFLDAKLVSGVQLLIEQTKLEKHIKQSKFIFTGEGCLDSQSLHNKTAIGIAKLAKKHKKKVVAVVGCTGHDYKKCQRYFNRIINVSENQPSNIKHTPNLIRQKLKNLKGWLK